MSETSDTIERLVLATEELAQNGNLKAQEILKELDEYRRKLQKIVTDEEGHQELELKNKLSKWIRGLSRGKDIEAKQLTAEDLELISECDIRIIYVSDCQMCDMANWHEDFQPIVFPDGIGAKLSVIFDDKGMVSEVKIYSNGERPCM